MIATQQEWKDYIVDSSVLGVQCNVTLANGASLTLTTDRIMEGTLQIHDEICDIGQIDIGGTVAQEISFSISNHDGQMSGYDFRGARCVLYLIANGVSIRKGVWTLYTNNTVGRVIPVYGYDHMADEQYNTPITSTISFNGMTAVNAIKSLGYTLESEDFPNASYVLPNVSTDDMGEGVTKRDVLGYICQLCGCYARYNHLGQLSIKYFDVLDFSDNLDGGEFLSPSKNLLLYPYDAVAPESGITWTDLGDGRIMANGTVTSTRPWFYLHQYNTVLDPHPLYLPVGTYILSGCPQGGGSSTYRIVLSINNTSVGVDTGDGLTFTITDASLPLQILLQITSGQGSTVNDLLFEPMIRVASDPDDTWEAYDDGWTTGDIAQGGLFVGAFGRNFNPYPYRFSGQTSAGLRWQTVPNSGGQLLCYGTSNGVTTFELHSTNTFIQLPPGHYKLCGCTGGSSDTYYMLVTKGYVGLNQRLAFLADDNDDSKNEYNGVTQYFTIEEDGVDLGVYCRVAQAGVNMGTSEEDATIFSPMILKVDDNNSNWTPYLTAWTSGDSEDGGLFGFWGRTIPISTQSDAYPLSKIMTEPVASLDRYIVTGVKVTGDNDIESMVGTEDYLIKIESNPFIVDQTVADAIATQVYSVVSGVNFYPFTVSWSADPSFEAGDLVSFNSLDREFITPCTSFSYTLGSMSNITCNDNDLNAKVDY